MRLDLAVALIKALNILCLKETTSAQKQALGICHYPNEPAGEKASRCQESDKGQIHLPSASVISIMIKEKSR